MFKQPFGQAEVPTISDVPACIRVIDPGHGYPTNPLPHIAVNNIGVDKSNTAPEVRVAYTSPLGGIHKLRKMFLAIFRPLPPLVRCHEILLPPKLT